MEPGKFYRTLLVISSFLSTGCSPYYPDLKAESAGSVLGGFAGLVSMGHVTSDITAWGAGTIVGSVFGGIIGQNIDNCSPLRLQNPPEEPISIFYVQTLRPPLINERFYPAAIFSGTGEKAVELLPENK